MNFYQYADFLYRKAGTSLQSQYSTKTDGLAKCANMLIHGQRKFYEFAYVPVIVFQFLAIKLGFKTEQYRQLEEFIEKEREAKAEREKKLEDQKVKRLQAVPNASEPTAG